MVLIEFFQCTAEPNRVDKSRYLTRLPNYSVQGLIKEECSVLSPVVEVQYNAGPFLANYARIDEFGRDYFVKNIVCVRQNYWRVYLEVDVLSSYGKYVIEDIPCVIDRNEYEYNPYLNDPIIPFTENVKLKQAIKKDVFNFDINGEGNDFCYVIKIMSNADGKVPPIISNGNYDVGVPYMGNPYAIGGEAIYILPLYGFNIKYNNGATTTIFSAEELKRMISINEQYQSYTISMIQFKFDLLSASGMNLQWDNKQQTLLITDTYNQVSLEKITIGNTKLDYYGFRILPRFRQYVYTSFSMSELDLTQTFKDFEPYTRRQIYLPYYGAYTINMKDLYPFKNYKNFGIYYIYEPDSGQALIELILIDAAKTNIILDSLNVSLGSPIDINTSTVDKVNRQKLVNQTNYAIEQERASTAYSIGMVNVGRISTNGIISMFTSPSILSGIAGSVGAVSNSAFDTAINSIQFDSSKKIAEMNKYAADIVNIPYGIKASKSLSITNSYYIDQDIVTLYVYENEIINDNEKLRYHTYGRSLNSARQNLIGTYGFTVLMDFHLERLSPHITTTELETLSSILKSGILLPDKPR